MSTVDEVEVERTVDEEGEVHYETGSLQTESLPYHYESEVLALTIQKYTFDGADSGDRGVLSEGRRLLSLEDIAGWDTVTLEGELELEQETIESVFPMDEWEEPPARLAVVVTCPTAISRRSVPITEETVEAKTYEFSVELRQDEYREDVFLLPFLIRGAERKTDASNRATMVGARLADGEPWAVRLDERPNDGGLLEPLVEPFSDHDKFPDETHLHYLDMDEPENPQLFLNADHPTIVQVLNNEGATGGPPRLRDVLFDYIEHSVWMQLLLRTAQDLDEDTGETRFDWQEDVVDLFHEELYPALERDEAAVRLAKDVSDTNDLHLLVRRLERVVNDRVDLPHDTQRLVEEGIQNVD